MQTFAAHAGQVNGIGVAPSTPLFASCGDDGCVRLWDARAPPLHESAQCARGFPDDDITEVQLVNHDASALECFCLCASHLVRVDWRQPTIDSSSTYSHFADLCSLDARNHPTEVAIADEDGRIVVVNKRTMSASPLWHDDASRFFGGDVTMACGVVMHRCAPSSADKESWLVTTVSMDGFLSTYAKSDTKEGSGFTCQRSRVGRSPVPSSVVSTGGEMIRGAPTHSNATCSNPPLPVSLDFDQNTSKFLVARGDGRFLIIDLQIDEATRLPFHQFVLEAPGHQCNGLVTAQWCPNWFESTSSSCVMTAATSGEIFVWGLSSEESDENDNGNAGEEPQEEDEEHEENDEGDDGEYSLPRLSCHFSFFLRDDAPPPPSDRHASDSSASLNTAICSAAHRAIFIGDDCGRIVMVPAITPAES